MKLRKNYALLYHIPEVPVSLHHEHIQNWVFVLEIRCIFCCTWKPDVITTRFRNNNIPLCRIDEDLTTSLVTVSFIELQRNSAIRLLNYGFWTYMLIIDLLPELQENSRPVPATKIIHTYNVFFIIVVKFSLLFMVIKRNKNHSIVLEKELLNKCKYSKLKMKNSWIWTFFDWTAWKVRLNINIRRNWFPRYWLRQIL